MIIVQSPAPDLTASKHYYTRLGFVPQDIEGRLFVSDGSALIWLNPNKSARAGLVTWSENLSELHQHFVDQPHIRTDEYLLVGDPSGVWTTIYAGSAPELPMPAPCGILGTYAGVSLETISIPDSARHYELLGLVPSMGLPTDAWMSLTHPSGFGLSLMKPNSCPHLFFNPSLTYFNSGENLAVIDNIRAQNIPIIEEITEFNEAGIVDNVIIRDPGGLGFFIFND